MSKLICVIGAGAAGLTAIKQCLDEGFDVICYEKTEELGGLWRYRENVTNGVSSVAKTTIMTSSKELSAFSDFPPDKHAPNYMDNKIMCNYLESYVNHFDLRKHIRFNHSVISVVHNDDYEESGKWKVTVFNEQQENKQKQIFDGVLVCNGHHAKPMIPHITGQEKFEGKIMHSCEYKTCDGFEDKNVVVVGIGSSGGDIATEVSSVANQVYLSIRRGAWVVPRLSRVGTPYDVQLESRIMQFVMSMLPENVTKNILHYFLNSHFNHNLCGSNPEHQLLSQHLTVNDVISSCIRDETIFIRKSIKEFTKDGLIFEGSDEETKCDIVLFATGYEISFPFLDATIISVVQNKVKLFKNVFLSDSKHPHTLGFIGLIQSNGPPIPMCELQARWFAKLMTGSVKLPSKDTMFQSIEDDRIMREAKFYDSPRHTLEVNFITYLDEIASFIEVKPNLWKYLLTDQKLWYAVVFGPSLSYQYRLDGPNKWCGARQAILGFYNRLKASRKD